MELHVNLAELLGSLFKTHGQSFLPAFNELLLPSMLEMARPESLSEDKKVHEAFDQLVLFWRRYTVVVQNSRNFVDR